MGQFKAFQGWEVYRKLPRKVLKVLDGHAVAIARLKIHGIMTEAEALKAWERLIQKAKKEIKIHNKGSLKAAAAGKAPARAKTPFAIDSRGKAM
jgi:hypothetical protein